MDEEGAHDLPTPHSPPPSFKQKLKNCLCCYRHHHYRRRHSINTQLPSTDGPKPTLIWVKTIKLPHELAGDFKDKCKGIFSRRVGNHNHRRHSSAEFRYDPLSYSLNFEDGCCDDSVFDEEPFRNFSARLPPSP